MQANAFCQQFSEPVESNEPPHLDPLVCVEKLDDAMLPHVGPVLSSLLPCQGPAHSQQPHIWPLLWSQAAVCCNKYGAHRSQGQRSWGRMSFRCMPSVPALQSLGQSHASANGAARTDENMAHKLAYESTT